MIKPIRKHLAVNRWPAVQAALFPVALLGFAAMVAFYFVRGVIVLLLLSPPAERIRLAIAHRLPPETAHKMAMRILKMSEPFVK